ncbi:GGDEF domain-containing protein [Sulfurihydrogenibium sp.]|uniref:GGDEF domain-containing protein n=1 Tax=Sulfurihydrogenibium sp. TaxID=2053621 RepID=UPI003D10BEFA
MVILSDEKIDIIFNRLLVYVERNFKSFVHKENLLYIKHTLKRVLEDKDKAVEFEEIGHLFAESNILFIESVFVFDFLRKNFIAHLPNDIDLREAKRVERLFEDIINYFSKGYLKNYCIEKIENINFIEENIIPKEMIEVYSHHLKTHIDYLRNFLYSIIDNKTFSVGDYNSCEFSIWLKREGRNFIDEEVMLKKVSILDHVFHNLINITEDYKKKGLYKEVFFSINEIEDTFLQILTYMLYLNTKALTVEFSKDPLTGALTRRVFYTILKKHIDISELTKLPISIIMADLDFFKKINDTYGHLVGDEALKHFVRVIKENIRKSDYVFRFGGEEFIILLPHTSLKEAVEIAEKIRKSLESKPLVVDGKEIKITASFGVRELNLSETIESNIKSADENLYRAKELGRNRVEF